MSAAPPWLHRMLAPPVLAIALAAVGYGASVRFTAPPDSLALWDPVVEVVTGPQFFAFVVAPVWLTFVVRDSAARRASPSLLRWGSRGRALRATVLDTVGWSASASLVVTVALLAVSSGLPVADSGHGPLSAPLGVLLQCLVYTTWLATTRVVISAAGLIRSSWVPPLGIAVSVWVGAILAMTEGPDARTATSPRLYLSYTTVLSPTLALVASIATVLLVCAAFGWVARVDARTRAGVGDSVTPVLLALTGVASIVTIGVARVAASGGSYVDSVSGFVVGPPGTLVQAVTSGVLWVGYAWALCIRDAAAGPDYRDLELLRFGSAANRTRRALATDLRRVPLLVAGFGLLCALAFIEFGGGGFGHPPGGITLWIAQVLVGGSLVVSLGVVVARSVVDSTRSSVAGLIAVGALVVLLCLPASGLWNPFAGAAISRIESGWGSVITGWVAVCGAIGATLLAGWLAQLRRSPRLRASRRGTP